MTIEINVTVQNFPVVLFILLYKVVLTLKSVNDVLKFDYSHEGCGVVLSCRAVV